MRVRLLYIVSGGDDNMCSAFMPFKHKSMFTGETYDPVRDIDKWDSGEWISEDGTPWGVC